MITPAAQQPGRIVVLNGAPRSGKSSIAAAIQDTFDGVWMNLGVDQFKQMALRATSPALGYDLEVSVPTSSRSSSFSSAPCTRPSRHTVALA